MLVLVAPSPALISDRPAARGATGTFQQWHSDDTLCLVDHAVFVGRTDELARFRAVLGEVSTSQPARFLGRWRRHTPKEGEVDRPRVLLVHGQGGIGKSWLMRQFEAMADANLAHSPVSPGRVRTAWLDWEDERRERPSLYAGAEAPNLLTVLDALQRKMIDACGSDAKARDGAGRAFASYRDAAARMPQYAAKFAAVARTGRAGSQFTPGDAAALSRSLASIGLTLGGHPAGALGLSPDQVATSAQAVGRLSEAAIRAVTGKKSGEIPLEEYDLVTAPERELTRRVAVALSALTVTTPLVLFLDTGEVMGSVAWNGLRLLMTQTGSRVVWVVGARLETEAGAGTSTPVADFVRHIGSTRVMLMSPTRFDDQLIADYLRSRTPGRDYTNEHIDLIARFTRCLPLAISLAAELLEHGEDVEDVCAEMDNGLPGNVVSRLARRYLVHTDRQDYPPDNPRNDDLAKILGLALAYGDLRADPNLLAALWNVTDPLAAFQDLARRHDFVSPLSRRLHDGVRDTLRTDLLDPYRREQVRDANQRALALYRVRLGEMRDRWPTLDEQIDHAEFKAALLAHLWHAMWLDSHVGLDLFLQMLPVLAVADRPTANAAASVVDHFAATLNKDQQRDLDGYTELTSTSRGELKLAHSVRIVRFTPASAMLRRVSMATADLLIGEMGDRQAAVTILQQQQYGRKPSVWYPAIEKLRSAARSTNSARLRIALRYEVDRIATEWLFGPPDAGIVTTPVELLSRASLGWIQQLRSLLEADCIDEALADFDLVIRTGYSNLPDVFDSDDPEL